MFDIGWSELLLIGAVALVVIGPKDLPKALRAIGQATAKIRQMASEFQGTFNEAMREAELDTIKRDIQGMADTAKSATNFDFNPVETARNEIRGAIEGGTKPAVTSALDDQAAAAAINAQVEPPPPFGTPLDLTPPAQLATGFEALEAPKAGPVPAVASSAPMPDPSRTHLPESGLPESKGSAA
jgi:sec-independent protein translocase protein TatB